MHQVHGSPVCQGIQQLLRVIDSHNQDIQKATGADVAEFAEELAHALIAAFTNTDNHIPAVRHCLGWPSRRLLRILGRFR